MQYMVCLISKVDDIIIPLQFLYPFIIKYNIISFSFNCTVLSNFLLLNIVTWSDHILQESISQTNWHLKNIVNDLRMSMLRNGALSWTHLQ